jgi:hypothetical protein
LQLVGEDQPNYYGSAIGWGIVGKGLLGKAAGRNPMAVAPEIQSQEGEGNQTDVGVGQTDPAAGCSLSPSTSSSPSSRTICHLYPL